MTSKSSFNGFGGKREVDMMRNNGSKQYCETKTAEVLILPYRDSSLRAMVILPRDASQ